MRKTITNILIIMLCIFQTACGKTAADVPASDQPQTANAPGIEPDAARAYLAVVDEIAAHLGYDEAEASEGEFLHGGFLFDWDGDGTQELCLLLKTSPREPDSWDGTPLYGWYAPTLSLYTYQNGQAMRAGDCDLYFSTAGREAAVASVMTDKGMQYVRWDHYGIENVSYAGCYEFIDGTVQKTEMPSEHIAALESADSVQAFLDALGADRTQLLLYNSSGEAGIAAEQNARELRDALAGYAA